MWNYCAGKEEHTMKFIIWVFLVVLLQTLSEGNGILQYFIL